MTSVPAFQPRCRRRSLGVGLACAAALALAACGSSQTTSSTSPTTAAPDATGSTPAASACKARQLGLAYAGTEGATGHLELTLSLRNVSRTPCAVRGYPGERLLDASGRALPMRVRRGGGFFPDTRQRPRVVVLAPGRRARYGVSFATNNEYAGARRCVTVAALDARPPGTSRWVRLALAGGGRPRITPCGRSVVLSPVYASA